MIIGGIRKDDDAVHLDYIVPERQNFDQAVYWLLQLLQQAQRDYPREPRHLHLAIEGHRLPNGNFDQDMLELQSTCEVNNPPRRTRFRHWASFSVTTQPLTLPEPAPPPPPKSPT